VVLVLCIALAMIALKLYTCFLAPSAAPDNLNVTAISSRELILSWTDLAEAEWNGDTVGFRIEVLEVESGILRNFTVTNMATARVVDLLHPCYTYHCKVTAYNSVGTGPATNTSLTMPEDCTLLWMHYQYN